MDDFEDVAVTPKAGDRINLVGGMVHYTVLTATRASRIPAVMAERRALVRDGDAFTEHVDIVAMDACVWLDLVARSCAVEPVRG